MLACVDVSGAIRVSGNGSNELVARPVELIGGTLVPEPGTIRAAVTGSGDSRTVSLDALVYRDIDDERFAPSPVEHRATVSIACARTR